MDTQVTRNDTAGRYELHVDGERAAIADFTLRGDVVVLPHPRPARGRAPIVVLVESQPVTITSDGGTVNDAEEVVVTTVGAMVWYSTGTEWWGSAVGGSSGGGGSGFTPTFATPVDVGLTNTEGVSTDFARADHVHRDRIAPGSEDGFLPRRVFGKAASAKAGLRRLD